MTFTIQPFGSHEMIGIDLYVAGESRSFAEGENLVGESDAILLRLERTVTQMVADGISIRAGAAGHGDSHSAQFRIRFGRKRSGSSDNIHNPT